MKKIMLIANTSWYVFNFRSSLIIKLQSQGYKVIVVAPLDSYTAKLENKANHFIEWQLSGAGINPILEIKSLLQLVKIIKQQQPEIILSYTPKANIYTNLVSRLFNVSVISNVSGLGSVFINKTWLQVLVKILYKFAFAKTSKVFFQNQDDLDLFLNLQLVTCSQTKLLPGSGVDVDLFAPRPETSNPHNNFIFMFVGRLLKEKGLVEFLDAARTMKSKNSQVEFWVLGEIASTNPSSFTKLDILDHQNQGTIKYLGATDLVQDYISQVDCVVLPSYREGMPKSLLEASSMGKPIITTNVPGCRQVLEVGVTGLMCEAKDAAGLAQQMQTMVDFSPEQRKSMGEKGRERMCEFFSERIVLDAYFTEINTIYSQDQ